MQSHSVVPYDMRHEGMRARQARGTAARAACSFRAHPTGKGTSACTSVAPLASQAACAIFLTDP